MKYIKSINYKENYMIVKEELGYRIAFTNEIIYRDYSFYFEILDYSYINNFDFTNKSLCLLNTQHPTDNMIKFICQEIIFNNNELIRV
jgi:hypothetical protein